jgi:hypothetical protein
MNGKTTAMTTTTTTTLTTTVSLFCGEAKFRNTGGKVGHK